MSHRQGHLLARGISAAAIPQALLAAASHAPADAGYERFVLSEEGAWTAALLLDGLGHVHQWAQALSLERGIATVSFFVLEGTWGYEIFDRGEHVLGMEFFPHERPLLRGDTRAAATLLGCEEDLFARYHRAILIACNDPEGDAPRAYEDDQFEAADEYGFADFARRAGLPDDPLFDDDPVGIVAPTPRPKEWAGLPPVPSTSAPAQ